MPKGPVGNLSTLALVAQTVNCEACCICGHDLMNLVDVFHGSASCEEVRIYI